MHFWGLIGLSLAALCANTAFAEGLSKDYLQCTTATYGNTDVIQKCIKKELKQQDKRMNKYYKKYLKNSNGYADNYKNQHELWAFRVNKVCGTNNSTVHAYIAQQQCILGMTVERAEFYKKKTRAYE